MRRHARASSARSKARKPVGRENASSSGRLRLAVLAAAVAAFLLVPVAAAQAAAGVEHVEVKIKGTGAGKITSGFNEILIGSPEINCTYASPGPATGTCKALLEDEGEYEQIRLNSLPAVGSKFVEWEVENYEFEGCVPSTACLPYVEPPGFGEDNGVVTAVFDDEPGEPLNVKIEGKGTVVSSPAGIECAYNSEPHTCWKSYAENTKVTLTASPSSGYTFLSWKGCETGGALGHTCKVTMDKAKTVVAKFGPVQPLTLTKAGAGTGSVKSLPSGIYCDANCSSNVAAFTEGASVTLTATPTKYNTFTEWSGAEGCSAEPTCVVTMSAAKSVTATFALVPKYALTLKKAGSGTGTVKSKPSSINCGVTCSSAVSSFYAGTEVEITATPAKGSALIAWSTGAGTCTGSTNPCKVTMSAAKELVAKFE